MNFSFDTITSLQYRLKAAIAELAAFKSGKKHLDMQETHQKEVRFYERKTKNLQAKLAQAHRDLRNIRDQWYPSFLLPVSLPHFFPAFSMLPPALKNAGKRNLYRISRNLTGGKDK